MRMQGSYVVSLRMNASSYLINGCFVAMLEVRAHPVRISRVKILICVFRNLNFPFLGGLKQLHRWREPNRVGNCS
jgi:hypothetical protein